MEDNRWYLFVSPDHDSDWVWGLCFSPRPWSAAESARTWAPRPRTHWPPASRGSCKTSSGHWSASARVGPPQLLENIERIITNITPLLMFNIWRFLNRGERIYLSFVSCVINVSWIVTQTCYQSLSSSLCKGNTKSTGIPDTLTIT